MTSQELRKAFLEFYKKNGHKIVPSSSLIPDDTSVLLTTAGMQQFKPYYTGEADPMKSSHPSLGGESIGSKNVVSIQKSFRTSDIDEVGDETHLTFFEMMGNFSFGGYFKKEAITFAYDFLKEIGITIEYVTIFEGDKDVPKDEESKKIWEELGVTDVREMNREENFWGPTGSKGPCGPTTEIFVNGVEIWNIVFNEYYCNEDKSLDKLDTPGVDTGMGLERLVMTVQDKANIFETDLFSSIRELIPESVDSRTKRILADHIRSISFLLSDGIRPLNKEAGYVLRRLMRRVMVYEYLNEGNIDTEKLFLKVHELYSEFYTELNSKMILEEFSKEKEKFQNTLSRGMKELNSLKDINSISAFKLYESFGLPFEIVKELGGDRAKELSREGFEEEFKKHQEASKAGAGQKFGGHGLILNTGELKASNEKEIQIVTRLHTATHLMQAALRKVLGDSVKQAGSDITPERTRFDFVFDRRLTDKEVKEVEDLVNGAIEKELTVELKEMPLDKAKDTGALYSDRETYPGVVNVYSMVDSDGTIFSSELCGGPHVINTKEVGVFSIVKQESVAAGVRRIRAKISQN